MPARLANLSIRQLLTLYSSLPPVAAEQRSGLWCAHFVGPWWLRMSAAPGISLFGLPAWLGTRFDAPHAAVNVLRAGGATRDVLPMHCSEQPSWFDGQPCVAVAYGAKARMPWRWVRDELRQVDENLWLCLTFINLPLLRRLPFPFVLVRDAKA